MGISLGRLVDEIGGGVPGQERFKAVQTGGPSGGIIPYHLKETFTDYHSHPPRPYPRKERNFRGLRFHGSDRVDHGGGGMIVMDDHDCVVDVARYFLNFLHEESWPEVLPCLWGLKGMLENLNRIAGARACRRISMPWRAWGRPWWTGRFAAWAVRSQPRAHQYPVLQRRVPGPHRGPQMPGGSLPGPHHLSHRPGGVQWLRAVLADCPGRTSAAKKRRPTPLTPGPVSAVGPARPCARWMPSAWRKEVRRWRPKSKRNYILDKCISPDYT